MAIGREQIFAVEEKRVTAAFEAAGGLGLTAVEKTQRLVELRSALRPLLAQRELAWRKQEAAGTTVNRIDVAAELYLAREDDLQAVADGREEIAA